MKSTKEINLITGHRTRIKERFLKAPIRSLPDYEIIEMILFYSVPRVDTKLIAKRLLEKFGSLHSLLSIEPARLREVSGVGEAVVLQFRLLNDLFSRLFLPTNNKECQVFNNWENVINYCKITMGSKSTEIFKVLYLNKKNNLIEDYTNDYGTVDKVHVYPREIAKKALECNATAIILVHNHPSGEATPSKIDIELTKTITNAMEAINIKVHDHLIVAGSNFFSFKENKLI